MPERVIRRGPPRQRQPTDPLVAAARTFLANQRDQSARNALRTRDWQRDLWEFHDTLSEFAWAVSWLSNAMSRVRLQAAEVMPGGDEPTPITEGPAAEAVARLGAGIGGHSAILKALTPHLSVPGEGWLVGEPGPADTEQWTVRSTEEIRPSTKPGSRFEVKEDEGVWRALDGGALVTRIWEPDPKLRYEPWSLAKSALPIMRRIDLLDRRIIATLVSRLAMNGIMLIPQEGTITTPAQYKDAADPFVAMLIDIASNNIRNPGNASAGIPMPIKFPSAEIEKWKHLTFGDPLSEELLEERDKELRRLATGMNVPAEVVLGMADANHWTAWQLEESAIKLHISPLAETIVHGLTTGFLYPMLEADGATAKGPNGGTLVVWYDTSELTARPDKSEQAFAAYDRLELSPVALLRETGLDEGDAPQPDELTAMILKKLVTNPQLAAFALAELTGTQPPQGPETPAGGADLGGPEAEPPPDGGGTGPAPPAGRPGPPDTQGEPPPPPNSDAARLSIPGPAPYGQLGRELAGVGARGSPSVNGSRGSARPPPGKKRGGRR